MNTFYTTRTRSHRLVDTTRILKKRAEWHLLVFYKYIIKGHDFEGSIRSGSNSGW